MLNVAHFAAIRQGQALTQPVDFNLGSGEILWISGQNGVGKSSFLKALLGLLPSQGRCNLQPEIKPAYLSHAQGLHPDLSPWEYAYTHPAAIQLESSKIKHELKSWDVPQACWHRPIYTLSQGQKARLALAGLALTQAQLWLLDEPFAALDPQALVSATAQLQQRVASGASLVIVSHQDIAHLATQHLLLEAAL